MDYQYKVLHEQALGLQNKFHDFTAGVDHPEVHLMQHEIHQLTEEIEQGKNPRHIEDRIKTIQHQLLQSEHSGSALMHYEHKDFMHDNYEQMRQSLRHFDHY